MKIKYLAIACLAASLAFGCAQKEVSLPPANSSPAPAASPVPATSLAAPKTASFVAGEHPTQGSVKIITENQQRYLEISKDFQTSNGPDVFVIFHRAQKPPIYGIKEQDYAIVSPLQKFKGAQRYEIPEKINLANFRSIAVWCRKFNATFGYASIGS